MPEGQLIAKGSQEHFLLPRMANRHGLVAGATGTGKTVALRVVAVRTGFSLTKAYDENKRIYFGRRVLRNCYGLLH